MGTVNVALKTTVLGVAFSKAPQVTYDAFAGAANKVVAAATTGTVTARTDNDTGSVTLATGHGITTGGKLDIYWSESGVRKRRINMTVGTVAGDVVPLDGGTGDNFPALTTAVTAMRPQTEAVAVTGDNVVYFGAKSSRWGSVYFLDGSGNLLAQFQLNDSDSGGSYIWYTGSGVTNPLAGLTTVTLAFSHYYSGGSATMSGLACYN